MNYLKNKTIIILSPQKWNSIQVSKHHYAIQLAKDNNVIFINPPSNKENISNSIYNKIRIIDYKLIIPTTLRYKSRFIFNLIIKSKVKSILKNYKIKGDIVWCFDPNIFNDLNVFNCKTKIFHPVDPITEQEQINVANTADVIFSVSQKILSSFNKIKKPKYFINHGLGNDFVNSSKKYSFKEKNRDETFKVGYVGNLIREAIDRDLFLELVSQNTDVDFYLWGPSYSKNDNGAIHFIKKLSTLNNVILKGIKKGSELANDIKNMDFFFLTYKNIPHLSDRSNSHKLIEYLNTGKPIISIDIETYRNNNLILMTKKNDNEMLDLFNHLKNNYSDFHNENLFYKRIEYAHSNSMSQQINKIDSILANL
ncbi:glycosyltransferase family 4 protein [Flammeovirga agarivorans]|uniref:Glycosyltransferase family 4 protein n=1 Tax=Flammeovirga agarivorans TaxID=2726742 RepID=A0A7X8SI38_9BACT|nr:glycosyltransferase family 4 protein [Flammeovirga agarivorans]NLR90503.1 glycosyltransferase family 4 protein [Flammeovirga agarivorans]